jgi:hypothetical protein
VAQSSPYTFEPNGQLSSEQMKAVANPESANKDNEGVREAVAGELSRKGQGCKRPVVLAAAYGTGRRVLTTSLQPFPHFGPPPWLFPRYLFRLPSHLAVAKDIEIQEITLQYTLGLSPPPFTHSWTAVKGGMHSRKEVHTYSDIPTLCIRAE